MWGNHALIRAIVGGTAMWKILHFLNEYGITHRIIDKGFYHVDYQVGCLNIENNKAVYKSKPIIVIKDYTIENDADDYFTLKKHGKVLLTESGAEHFINCLHQHGYKTILSNAGKQK